MIRLRYKFPRNQRLEAALLGRVADMRGVRDLVFQILAAEASLRDNEPRVVEEIMGVVDEELERCGLSVDDIVGGTALEGVDLSVWLCCEQCRGIPSSLEQLALARGRFLFSRSHEHFRLCRCPACGCHFLEEFQESTDWSSAGSDLMWLRWLPLTPKEFEMIEELFPPDDQHGSRDERLETLDQLMDSRPRLVMEPHGAFSWLEPGQDAARALPRA